MEWPHLYVLALAAIATTLLALEKAHLSVVGVGLIVAVVAPGLISPEAGIAGFGNKAVVTIAALYIVGEGVNRTGAASLLASRILRRTHGRETTVALLIMGMAALLSAFVNNILVVVTFLPVITSICRETGLYPSRLLIPLSYASILGGMTTLVGTSTNLLVSEALEKGSQPALGMFEMTGAGILLALVGMLYVGLVGRHLLPRIPSLAAQAGSSDVREYVTEITVGPESPLVGMRIDEVGRLDDGTQPWRVGMAVRNEMALRPPFKDIPVRSGDILTIRGKVQDLAHLHHDPAHSAEQGTDSYDPSSMSFFELSLSPTSLLVDSSVRDLQLKRRHGAVVVGVMRKGEHIQERVADLRVGSGDVLLAFGSDRAKDSVRASADFLVIEGVQDKIYRRQRAPAAMLVVLSVVGLFMVGVEPVIAALAGALAMMLTGCVTAHRATVAVNWPLLMFIAGMLALRNALEATGADTMIGTAIADVFAGFGPHALLAGIVITTIVLTELVSNNAVAVMMTPIAIAAAHAAGVEDPRILVLAVAFGASTSFANPVGYHTNLIVFGPGGYRFRHFVRVGLGLDLLLAVVAIVVLPWFWPL